MRGEPPCLFAAEAIAVRVRELAASIRARHAGPLVLLGVLQAGCPFTIDLARALGAPLEMGFVEAKSYGAGTRPLGPVVVGELECVLVRGRTVVIADAVLDTGATLAEVANRVRGAGAAEVFTCVLLDKGAGRADFVGFEAPNRFLVGYGLDHAGRYRALPYVGAIDA